MDTAVEKTLPLVTDRGEDAGHRARRGDRERQRRHSRGREHGLPAAAAVDRHDPPLAKRRSCGHCVERTEAAGDVDHTGDERGEGGHRSTGA
jgi:hypothetical protein